MRQIYNLREQVFNARTKQYSWDLDTCVEGKRTILVADENLMMLPHEVGFFEDDGHEFDYHGQNIVRKRGQSRPKVRYKHGSTAAVRSIEPVGTTVSLTPRCSVEIKARKDVVMTRAIVVKNDG